MKRPDLAVGLLLLIAAAGLVLVLFVEASRGPTFRAEDYASFQECLRGIPAEWGPGSLERTSAETACHYVHERRR